MLKGIDPLLSPELLKILMEMGHGDEIVIGDGNFPGANYAKRLVRLDGQGIPAVLKAVLSVMPLDDCVPESVILMKPTLGDPEPEIWQIYQEILKRENSDIGALERFLFYERAREAYAVIATSEPSPYGNIILKKGFIKLE